MQSETVKMEQVTLCEVELKQAVKEWLQTNHGKEIMKDSVEIFFNEDDEVVATAFINGAPPDEDLEEEEEEDEDDPNPAPVDEDLEESVLYYIIQSNPSRKIKGQAKYWGMNGKWVGWRKLAYQYHKKNVAFPAPKPGKNYGKPFLVPIYEGEE
jgi:hypothetical protein